MSEIDSAQTERLIASIEDAMQRKRARQIPDGLDSILKDFLPAALALLVAGRQQDEDFERGAWSQSLQEETNRLENQFIQAAGAASKAVGETAFDEPPSDASIKQLFDWRRSMRNKIRGA